MLPQPIADHVDRFQAAWERGDAQALRALWAPAHPAPTYVAEEIAGVMVGLEQIAAYYHAVTAGFDQIRVQFTPVVCDLHGDLAWVMGSGGFRAIRRTDGRAVVSEGVRVAMLLCQTPDGWRFVHYVEAPRKIV